MSWSHCFMIAGEHLEASNPLYNDHNKMKALVKSGEILEEVEKTVGKLE